MVVGVVGVIVVVVVVFMVLLVLVLVLLMLVVVVVVLMLVLVVVGGYGGNGGWWQWWCVNDDWNLRQIASHRPLRLPNAGPRESVTGLPVAADAVERGLGHDQPDVVPPVRHRNNGAVSE